MTSASRTGSTSEKTCATSALAKQRIDLDDGVDLPDFAEELVAEALALAGALDEAGDVDESDRAGVDFSGLRTLARRVESRVGHGHHADVGVDGGEGVVGDLGAARGEGVEERRLADVGQPDDSY